jgi:hypothetical protein
MPTTISINGNLVPPPPPHVKAIFFSTNGLLEIHGLDLPMGKYFFFFSFVCLYLVVNFSNELDFRWHFA